MFYTSYCTLYRIISLFYFSFVVSMCSDFPSSESADIYKRLVAASVSRTKSSKNSSNIFIINVAKDLVIIYT